METYLSRKKKTVQRGLSDKKVQQICRKSRFYNTSAANIIVSDAECAAATVGVILMMDDVGDYAKKTPGRTFNPGEECP